MNEENYDTLIYDGARDIAVKFRNDEQGMRDHLISLYATEEDIQAVINAMNSPDYYEIKYRGEMCDEGVIETVKDILRFYHGYSYDSGFEDNV